MKKHTEKIIPPVIITAVCVIYLAVYAVLMLLSVVVLNIIGLLLAAAAIGGIVLSVVTLIERINEIEKGEEDDLSKY